MALFFSVNLNLICDSWWAALHLTSKFVDSYSFRNFALKSEFIALIECRCVWWYSFRNVSPDIMCLLFTYFCDIYIYISFHIINIWYDLKIKRKKNINRFPMSKHTAHSIVDRFGGFLPLVRLRKVGNRCRHINFKTILWHQKPQKLLFPTHLCVCLNFLNFYNSEKIIWILCMLFLWPSNLLLLLFYYYYYYFDKETCKYRTNWSKYSFIFFFLLSFNKYIHIWLQVQQQESDLCVSTIKLVIQFSIAASEALFYDCH